MLVVPIVRVGNSRGIRIPKKLLDAIGSPQAVQLDMRDGALIVSPVIHPRANWDDPAVWGNAKLTREDHEWLEADLTDEVDAG